MIISLVRNKKYIIMRRIIQYNIKNHHDDDSSDHHHVGLQKTLL